MVSTHLTRGLAALAVTALVACERAAPPPPAPRAPPAPPRLKVATGKWASSSANFQVEGPGLKYDARVGIYIADAMYHVTFVELPIGTRLTLDGEVLEAKKELTNFKLPIDARIADLAWDDLKEKKDPKHGWLLTPKFDWKTPLKLEMPGFEPLESTMPPVTLGAGLHRVFLALSTGRRWPNEQPGPVPAAAALVMPNGFEALGEAPRVRDVRLLAIAELEPNPRTRRCSGYLGARDFVATSYDVQLAIIDRLTLEVVATRAFTGQPACPKTVVATRGQAEHAEGPSYPAMKQWVLSQLKPLSKKLVPAP